MKTTILLTAILSAALTTSVMAQATKKKVALKVAGQEPAAYIAVVPGGGLNATGTKVGPKSTFVLTDANGGDLADGDIVQIKWDDRGKKVTAWQETGSTITRPESGDEAATKFTVKKTDAGISLKTASGKFVAVAGKSDPLAVTDDESKAAVFEVADSEGSGSAE